MKQKFYDAAQLVHSTMCLKSNCFINNQIINANQIVAIGDDITSALHAAKLYFEIKKTYHCTPRILCVGGNGLLSKYTLKKTEGILLAYVLTSLNIPTENIVIVDNTTNTGENVLAVAKKTQADTTTIWCCTKRMSLRLERTIQKQAPTLISYYYVIEQNIYEVMRYYNCKGFLYGEPLFHELASTLNRCETYAGTYQAPLNIQITDELREAANLLEQNFRLKLPNKNLKTLFQFIRLYFTIIFNKKLMINDIELAIKEFKLHNL